MTTSPNDVVLPDWVTADPGGSLTVSAGAGSGKTTSLVARVAALIETVGAPAGELVVITFTEKAAREVSHRLRQRLGNAVSLDAAYICSTHGCCQALLRRYPIEAGLPPRFTTADELTSGARADERAEQLVQELYNKAGKQPAVEQALTVMASFGAMTFLPDLVRAIDNDWLRFTEVPIERPVPIEVANANVMRMLDQVTTDQRYTSASQTMRNKIDAAVLDARTTLQFVDSVPALARAATKLNTY